MDSILSRALLCCTHKYVSPFVMATDRFPGVIFAHRGLMKINTPFENRRVRIIVGKDS